MLSRSAQGLYWMGRYLERTANLCRLLQLQVEALVDRPIPEIHFGWRRIYGSLKRSPLLGDEFESDESDEFTLADSFTLAGDLTFERSNPDSIRSCFALGRENARQIRHCISTEMWSCLNIAWLRLRELDIADIWRVSPESFYVQTAREIDTFTGVADSTMYRDEGWRFMRLGRSIERAQRIVALLMAHLAAGRKQEGTTDTEWTSLLRACQAFDAYKRSYSVAIQPDRVFDLLVTDPSLPGSLCRALDSMATEIAAIGPGPGPYAATERLAGRTRALVRYEWPDHEDHEALLRQAEGHCKNINDLIVASYFGYSIEDSLVR